MGVEKLEKVEKVEKLRYVRIVARESFGKPRSATDRVTGGLSTVVLFLSPVLCILSLFCVELSCSFTSCPEHDEKRSRVTVAFAPCSRSTLFRSAR
jgi:hypothetical protein